MAGKLFFAAAHPNDVGELERGMRWRDRDEVIAAEGGDVYTALVRALDLSDDPVTLRGEKREMIAIFGLAPTTLMSDTAAPWLLGTKAMDSYRGPVLAAARRYIAFARERYPRLVNYVDARNEPSVRWLRRLGFTVDPASPWGRAGLPFHRFHMGIENV